MCTLVKFRKALLLLGGLTFALGMLSGCAWKYIPESPANVKQDSLRDANEHDVDIREFFNH